MITLPVNPCVRLLPEFRYGSGTGKRAPLPRLLHFLESLHFMDRAIEMPWEIGGLTYHMH
jgi:hypothetical protein